MEIIPCYYWFAQVRFSQIQLLGIPLMFLEISMGLIRYPISLINLIPPHTHLYVCFSILAAFFRSATCSLVSFATLSIASGPPHDPNLLSAHVRPPSSTSNEFYNSQALRPPCGTNHLWRPPRLSPDTLHVSELAACHFLTCILHSPHPSNLTTASPP